MYPAAGLAASLKQWAKAEAAYGEAALQATCHNSHLRETLETVDKYPGTISDHRVRMALGDHIVAHTALAAAWADYDAILSRLVDSIRARLGDCVRCGTDRESVWRDDLTTYLCEGCHAVVEAEILDDAYAGARADDFVSLNAREGKS